MPKRSKAVLELLTGMTGWLMDISLYIVTFIALLTVLTETLPAAPAWVIWIITVFLFTRLLINIVEYGVKLLEQAEKDYRKETAHLYGRLELEAKYRRIDARLLDDLHADVKDLRTKLSGGAR